MSVFDAGRAQRGAMEEATTAPGLVVTVLMPVRDGERHLPAAIESVLAQSFRDFEFLVVDDGSEDASRDIARGYADSRIRLVENSTSMGVTRTLNRGLALARGRYIARMDADDLSAPDRLARQVGFLASNPDCVVVASDARKIDTNSAEIGVARTPSGCGPLRRALHRGNCITHGSVMMRADALREIGGYDEAMDRAEDYDLWLRLSERHAIDSIPELLYAWRDHSDGVSVRYREEQAAAAARARDASLRRRVFHALAGESRRSGGAVADLRDILLEEDDFRLATAPAG
ncbi:MAG: glycosyltransferase, partial [Myxococcota bacterium]